MRRLRGLESPEINSHIHGQLIFEKGTRQFNEGKNNLFTKWSGTTGYLYENV